jgi:muramoyltetrapeptide carboxypeptidase
MSVAVKPPALKVGDLIGIVAPASAAEAELVERGEAELKKLGFRTRWRPDLFAQDLFFAGPAERRGRETMEMYADPDVAGIVSARGGYGTGYVPPTLDLETLRRNPKVFMGYSDITMLQQFFRRELNWVVFQGPMVASGFSEGEKGYDRASFELAVMQNRSGWTLPWDGEMIRAGEAEGTLEGGCLSLLAAGIGTAWEIETSGAILFLEDTGVKPYQVDRMLLQLKLSGKLRDVRGIIFGTMPGCDPSGQKYSLLDVLRRFFYDFPGPVGFGFPAAHVDGPQLTVPLGVLARLTVTKEMKLEILEPAVR